MIGIQNSVIKAPHPFQFHEAFENWEGARYEEENVDGKRHYLIDGVRYPSITTVLAADMEKQAVLSKWRRRIGDIKADLTSSAATRRGTALHSLCESYILHGSAELKNHFERENLFKVKPILDKHVGLLYSVEKALYSKRLGVAGRSDLIAEWWHKSGAWEPTVIDFKTSTKTKYQTYINQYFIQGAAYATMFQEMTGIEIPRIAIIIATEEVNEPQVFVESTNAWKQSLDNAIKVYQESIHVHQKDNS